MAGSSERRSVPGMPRTGDTRKFRGSFIWYHGVLPHLPGISAKPAGPHADCSPISQAFSNPKPFCFCTIMKILST
jgi:hypothetical protein